jgi:hypothetical protein
MLTRSSFVGAGAGIPLDSGVIVGLRGGSCAGPLEQPAGRSPQRRSRKEDVVLPAHISHRTGTLLTLRARVAFGV